MPAERVAPLALVAGLALIAGCQRAAPATPYAALRAAFNADVDRVRVVMLVAPS